MSYSGPVRAWTLMELPDGRFVDPRLITEIGLGEARSVDEHRVRQTLYFLIGFDSDADTVKTTLIGIPEENQLHHKNWASKVNEGRMGFLLFPE